ncbi:MAG: TRAP transporter TatT component family protein [Nitrospinota bacterium]
MFWISMRQYIMFRTTIVRSLAAMIAAVFLTGMTSSTLKNIDSQYFNANSIQEFVDLEKQILKLTKSSPNEPELIWRLARNYFRIAKRTSDKKKKMRLFERCLETANRGILIEETSAENIYHMGLCLGNISVQKGIFSSLSNRDILKSSMEKVIKINPNIEYAGPHRFLGVYYNALPFFLGGDSDKAIFHLETAVTLAPHHADNLFYLGKIYFDNGYYAKAKGTLGKFLELARTVKNDPDMPDQIKEGNDLINRLNSYQNNE